MCPACISTLALASLGGATAGGLGMLALKKLYLNSKPAHRSTTPEKRHEF